MKIDIPANKPTAIMRVYHRIASLFPEHERDILRVIDKARHGITLRIEPLRLERTCQQERYYRKWCREFAHHCGYEADEMHEILLRKAFGTETFKGRYGKVRRPTKRSGDAERGEYSELIETLIRTAAEEGFVIPPPQPQLEE